MWRDSGTWIALGVSALFIAVAVAMSVVFRRILRQPPADMSAAHDPSTKTTADPERRAPHE
jgi:hypothetical protein